MTMLGDGVFSPLPVEVEAPAEDLLGLRLELVLAALEGLRESLTEMPTPQVFIDAPDLTAIVNAVNGLKPGADPDEIAAAVVRTIAPTATPAENTEWQGELVDALEKLDFRLKGFSGQGTSNANLPALLTSAPSADLGQASLPVRIISSVPGAGTGTYGSGDYGGGAYGGGIATSFTINDPTTTSQKLAVDASGRITVNLGTNTPDVTDRAARLLGHVTVDNASIPVTGTVTDNQGTPNTVANAWPVKNTDGTNTAAVKAASTAAAATDPALAVTLSPNSPLPVGTNSIGTVQQATLTKGTQGGTGVSTQDLKDAGRAAKTMFSAFVSTAAAETSISFQVASAFGAPAAAATSYTVTAGKTLRIQEIDAVIRAGGSAPAATLATLKIKVGGNQQGRAFMVAAPTTVAAGPVAFPAMPMQYPDGFELPAGSVLSFTLTLSTWTTAVNTPSIDINVTGFEY